MNAVPRLSIVLLVYNGEKYPAESLVALLGQTYRDFELIISDNASTDRTPEICRCYWKWDSRNRHIVQPRRQAGQLAKCAQPVISAGAVVADQERKLS
jgi:GT2 family glycosyltransferase